MEKYFTDNSVVSDCVSSFPLPKAELESALLLIGKTSYTAMDILFYFILFYFILFYLFYFIIF